MVTFRPHRLTFKSKGTIPSKDSSNNWVYPNNGEDILVLCRYDKNTQAQTIKNSDGEVVVYRGIVYFDKSTDLIPVGTLITITDLTQVVIDSGKVIQVIRGRLKSNELYI